MKLLDDQAPDPWRGSQSAIAYFRTAVITTPQDWKVLWREHQAAQAAPAVDFAQWIVVGVFAGTRTDLVAVDIVNIQSLSDQILVTYREVPLGPNMGINPPNNRPYALRRIPKTTLPIHFKKI